jgi:hypothetical protein
MVGMRRGSVSMIVFAISCAPKSVAEERPRCPPPQVVIVEKEVPASPPAAKERADEVPIEQEAAAEAELWARRMQRFDAARPDTEWARRAHPILAPEMNQAVKDLGGHVEQFECRGKSCRAQLRWPTGTMGHRLMRVRFSYNCARSSHQDRDADTSTCLFDCDREEYERPFQVE